MMRLRVLPALAVLALLASPAHAYLPANIEGVIKSWFSGSGKFQCIKVSGGGTANCLFGANMTLSNGCSVSGGIMTCSGGFDSPAATTTGTYFTWKEGSNNGTSTVKLQAPANLSTSRTNLFNADGTFTASDVATATANEYGYGVVYNSSTGALSAKSALTQLLLPGATPFPAGNAGTTALLATTNHMNCVTFVAKETVKNATKLYFSVDVATTTTGSCGICIYPASDSGTLIAPLVSGSPATAQSCASTGAKSKTGLDPFSIYEGQSYRLCHTGSYDTTSHRLQSNGQFTTLNNQVATQNGRATNTGTAGVCPTTTGAFATSATVDTPVVLVAQ